MITLFICCIANGFFFHYDMTIISEETKLLIAAICVASELNLLATIMDHEGDLKKNENCKH